MNITEKQKYRLLIGLIFLTILPLPLIAHPSRLMFTDVASFMLYSSSVLGYLGIVLLLWMYVLGTKSVIGLYFRDMASVMKVHKWLGTYGTLFIFAHPLAAALAYGQNVILYSILPNLSTNFDIYVTWGRFALYALIIIWVTSAIARGAIGYRPWKYIHYVAYVALPLSLLHIPTIGVAFESERPAKLYFFVAVLVWVVFSLLRFRHLFMLGKLSYTVVSQQAATPEIMYLVMMPNQPARISHFKGQFIYLQMNLLGEGHPFSLLQQDKTTGQLTVAYKKNGRFTNKLSRQPSGMTLYVDGPYGVFTEELRDHPSDPVVYIAGGIGITPFVDHILTDSAHEQWLFYANRTRALSAFSSTLASKLGDHYVPILSMEDSAPTEHGYIRAELLTKYLNDPQRFHYFICGPPKMMELTVQTLINLDVPASHIHTEEFSY